MGKSTLLMKPLNSSTPTHGVTELPVSPLTALLPDDSLMKSKPVKLVSMFQSQFHFQCSHSLVTRALTLVPDIISMARLVFISSLNSRQLLNCGELKMRLNSRLKSQCQP